MAKRNQFSRAYHAERVWSHAARRQEVNHRATKKGASVYWVVREKEWFALRWCHVTEYDDGVIRFTSRLEPAPPRSLWPVRSSTFSERRLEITLASDELNERYYGRLAEIFTHPDRALDWELLQQVTSDTNLWSDRAVTAEKRAREGRAGRRRR
jgi:hypothetical protein